MQGDKVVGEEGRWRERRRKRRGSEGWGEGGGKRDLVLGLLVNLVRK